MQKNSITNKITPCCGLPFSVIYWWVSNLTLNSDADRQFILSKISQNGALSIDGWKVLVNSGTLEADASLIKAEFLAWFDCGKQPTCEQLKLIIEGYKISNWDYFKNSIQELNEAWQELENKLKLKYNDVSDSEAVDIIQRVDQFTGENVNYQETEIWADGTSMNDSKIDGKIYLKKGEKYYVDTEFLNNKIVKISRFINDGTKKIHEVFPNISISEVQEIEPTANLNNSSAWFLISKLLTWLPKESIVDIDIDINIDQTIVLKRGFIKFTSSGLKINKIETSSPFLGRRVTIKQTAQNKDIIKVIDGDGTIHINGYVENVVFENLNFIGNFTGDGISFHQTSNLGGTSIHFTFKNVLFGNCKNGFKHYSGHINDFFFEQASFSANYDIGFVLNSDNASQTNYFSFKDCRFDSNGLDTDINGNITDFVQDLQNPNWNKGGAKINGTAMTIVGVSMQANHGFGLWLYGYLYGGFFNGYSEQNVLGDLVADQTKENYKNQNCLHIIYNKGD